MAAPATEEAIDKMRQLILDGELPPGSRLPAEYELAAQLGLSRNTLREAVRALTTARVLDVRRGDGTYVTSLEPRLLLEGIGFAVELMQDARALELLELRRILEPAATALAATRLSAAALADLYQCLVAMEDSLGENRIQHDIEFHAKIATGSGNATLSSLLTGLSGKTVHGRAWHGVLEQHAYMRAHEEHRQIYDALTDRDPILAHAAAVMHVANTERWYRRMLEDEQLSRLPPRTSRAVR